MFWCANKTSSARIETISFLRHEPMPANPGERRCAPFSATTQSRFTISCSRSRHEVPQKTSTDCCTFYGDWNPTVLKRICSSCSPTQACSFTFTAFCQLTAPQTRIEAENCRPGNPFSEWYSGGHSPTYRAFATRSNVNAGHPVS